MVTSEQVLAAISNCFDPEIRGVNLVDLGLIYDVNVNEEHVDVTMTLTTPGCGMSRQIAEDVKSQVAMVEGISDVAVTIVWDPPWNPKMMSENAKKMLGFA